MEHVGQRGGPGLAAEGQLAVGQATPQATRAPQPDSAAQPAPRESRARRIGRHLPFALALTLAVALRVTTMLGYRWAMWFNDSFDYVDATLRLRPHPVRPSGYSILLWLLEPLHNFGVATAVQHLMGIGVAVMMYAVLRRRFALPGWGATLATLPVLFDAYQIQLEHLVLSDVLFLFLLAAAVVIALRQDRPTWRTGAVVGLLLGAATLVRSVGTPLLVVVLGYFALRRVGWRTLLATVVACALPVLLYMGWFASWYGRFALTDSTGVFLYTRVMAFADCAKIKPPAEEIPLCTPLPPSDRPVSQYYVWDRKAPIHRLPADKFSALADHFTLDFDKRAIKAQPLDYLRVTADDVFRAFQWRRTVFPDPLTYRMYEFGTQEKPLPTWSTSAGGTAATDAREYQQGARASTNIIEPFAGFMRAYQQRVYLRGTMLGVILLIGAVGVVARRRWRSPALLPWATALALLVIPAATAEFDYRYVLPAVPFACLAAAIALARRSSPASDRAAAQPAANRSVRVQPRQVDQRRFLWQR